MDNDDGRESVALPASGNGPAPFGLSPSVSPVPASIPSAGQYAIFDSGWSWGATYQGREITRVTPKQLQLRRNGHPHRVERSKLIAVVATAGEAARICRLLTQIDAGFQERRELIDMEATEKLRGAKATKRHLIREVLAASGIEARSDETLQAAQPERQEPGAGTADAPPSPDQPNS